MIKRSRNSCWNQNRFDPSGLFQSFAKNLPNGPIAKSSWDQQTSIWEVCSRDPKEVLQHFLSSINTADNHVPDDNNKIATNSLIVVQLHQPSATLQKLKFPAGHEHFQFWPNTWSQSTALQQYSTGSSGSSTASTHQKTTYYSNIMFVLFFISSLLFNKKNFKSLKNFKKDFKSFKNTKCS